MAVLPTFMGGLLLGLAGSLHCAGICGGIASATLLAARPAATARGRAGALLRIQSGRALTYTLAGAVAGTGSAGVAGLLDLAGANQLLRVAAALNLLWVGAALAGIGRGPRLLDGLARRAGAAAAGSRRPRCPRRRIGGGLGADALRHGLCRPAHRPARRIRHRRRAGDGGLRPRHHAGGRRRGTRGGRAHHPGPPRRTTAAAGGGCRSGSDRPRHPGGAAGPAHRNLPVLDA
mgnify:CR=1 FL=1